MIFSIISVSSNFEDMSPFHLCQCLIFQNNSPFTPSPRYTLGTALVFLVPGGDGVLKHQEASVPSSCGWQIKPSPWSSSLFSQAAALAEATSWCRRPKNRFRGLSGKRRREGSNEESGAEGALRARQEEKASKEGTGGKSMKVKMGF